jgi:hypothetical protein
MGRVIRHLELDDVDNDTRAAIEASFAKLQEKIAKFKPSKDKEKDEDDAGGKGKGKKGKGKGGPMGDLAQ